MQGGQLVVDNGATVTAGGLQVQNGGVTVMNAGIAVVDGGSQLGTLQSSVPALTVKGANVNYASTVVSVTTGTDAVSDMGSHLLWICRELLVLRIDVPLGGTVNRGDHCAPCMFFRVQHRRLRTRTTCCLCPRRRTRS